MGSARWSSIVGLLLWGAVAAPAAAAAPEVESEVEAKLLVPSETVAPGEASQLTLRLVNPTERAVTLTLEPELACRLDSPDGAFPLRAEARSGADAETVVPPGGSVEREYAFSVPEGASGAYALGCDVPGAPPTVLQVAAGEGKGQLPESVRQFASQFGAFEPVYFLAGIPLRDSKFQISFDYHLLNEKGPLAQRFPWLTGFHLAYTQTSLWDLESESVPFRDTSYKPEVHFLSPELPWKLPWQGELRFRGGYQHESNGRDGAESRSTNFAYFAPIAVFGSGEPWALEITPKAWIYVANDDRTNRDLPDYRGYFDLGVKLGMPHSLQVASHLRWGQKGGTVQADLTYPLVHLLFGNFDLYLQAQYFSGYAETLLDFDHRDEAFRLGVAMLR
jgi:outer membrane phospholipase A